MQAAFVTLSKPLTRCETPPSVCKQRPRVEHRPLIWTITSRQRTRSGEQSGPPLDDEGSAKDARRRRMPMRPETRKKISDALKGRRKSAQHRESLRRRFEGSQNPMYGRKRSAESRAKISRAMSAKAKQKKAEQPEKPPVQEEALDQLREKAMDSRLIASAMKPPERRVRNRAIHDELESAHVDRLLQRVARLEEPPESVVRTLNNNREKRLRRANQTRVANHSNRLADDKQTKQVSHAEASQAEKTSSTTCPVCNGTGLTQCPKCIASCIPSSRCELCFGAGGVFCDTCNGVGAVTG